MKKINVLEIIRSAEGGMKKHFTSLLKGMDKEKFNIYALCFFDSQTTKDMRQNGISIISHMVPGSIHPLYDSITIMKILAIIKGKHIDIIHVHGFKASLVGRIAGYIANKPVVYTVHNFIFESFRYPCMNKLMMHCERKLAVQTKRIITVSKALEEEYKNLTNADRIKTIYNGIQAVEVKAIERKKNNGVFIIGTASRLIPSKGIQYLIDGIEIILAENRNIIVEIAGDGPQWQQLKQYIDQKKLSKYFVFHGFCSNMSLFYQGLDLFVLPSLKEGLGISLLEAMSFGVPVAAAKVGGIPEIIKDGVNGELFPPGDSYALAQTITALWKNEEKRKMYIVNGLRMIQEMFREDDMIASTQAVLQDVVL